MTELLLPGIGVQLTDSQRRVGGSRHIHGHRESKKKHCEVQEAKRSVRTIHDAAFGLGILKLMNRSTVRRTDLFAGDDKTLLWDCEDERDDRRRCHARFGIIASIVTIGLVVETAVVALSHCEPPAIGIHEFAKTLWINIRAECGVGHPHRR